MELGASLAASGLTSLVLSRTPEGFALELAREWDPSTDFSGYARDFSLDTPLAREPRLLGDVEARSALDAAGATLALGQLEAWMRAGRHEQVRLHVHAELGIRLCHFVHSSRLGLRNGFHALRAGGIRRHSTRMPEHEVLRDGLNLARAMSFKCAAADMPFGGSKTTVQSEPIDPSDRRRLGFLAWCIDRGNLMTGPDVGFAPELVDALAESFTPHILCGPHSPLGHTGAPTAEGVLAALRAAAEHRWGTPSLGGRKIAIQGLGSVGLELASQLAGDGASLVAADPDPERVALARARVPSLAICDPRAILGLECDVLCPCGLGGVFTADSIGHVRAELVYGGANNQLDAFTTEEELTLSDLFASRGVSFQPDWSYTMGGILCGWEEYRNRESASSAKLHADISRVAGAGTRELLAAATESGKTPTALAVSRYFPLVHGMTLAETSVR